MALNRLEGGALAAAGLVAVAIPALMLRAPERQPAESARPAAMLAVPSTPPIGAVYRRALFASDVAAEANAPLPSDAPRLIGVAGRIGRDAVALVRGNDGQSRALVPGEAVDGWTLESVAIDAAFFVRGGQQQRVPVPTE